MKNIEFSLFRQILNVT